MTSRSLQDPIDRLQKLGLALRNRNGVDWNTGKFELRRREVIRVEFFRGRDFERYFVAHTNVLEDYAEKKTGKSPEEQTVDLGNRFLKSGLITKAQRKFKRPKPGKKRLVKWPRTLLPDTAPQEGWERNAFYVWAYPRPTSSWTYILSMLLVVGILAGCLLPIAPYIVKLCVFYISLSLLFVLFGFLSVRGGLWFVVWLLTGRDFWILPNVLSDEAGLKEAFTPVVSFEKVEGLRSHVLLRLLTGALIGALCAFLLTHNPGRKVVGERAKEAHDSLLDLLSIKHPSQQLEGNSTKTEL